MLYGVAYLQTGMLMILALQRCFPPPPSPSPGLLLYTEGNKDTRRISVVCLTKWLPESERAMPMGSTATPLSSALPRLCRGPPPARASLRSALSQGALWMCDRLWVGEFVLMLKRQRTQTDNPRLKQRCSNFPPLNKGTCVQTVKFNSITYSVRRAYFPAKDFPTALRWFKNPRPCSLTYTATRWSSTSLFLPTHQHGARTT